MDDVLGYTDKLSSWGRSSRKCLPSKDRERFIIEQSNRGVGHISLRLINRYIDEYLVFIQENEYESILLDDLTFNRYETYISRNNLISDKTKQIKLSTAKRWIKWLIDKNK